MALTGSPQSYGVIRRRAFKHGKPDEQESLGCGGDIYGS